MLNSPALDVAAGLALVYFLFAVVISKVNETITSWLGTRHQGLEKALTGLLGSQGSLNAESVLEHPLVQGLQTAAESKVRLKVGAGSQGISYLPARTFSAAVLDLLAPPDTLNAHKVLTTLTTDGMSDQAQAALTAAEAQPGLTQLGALRGLLPAGADQDAVAKLATQLGKDPLENALTEALKLPSARTRDALVRMITDAKGDRDLFRQKLEHWYDDAMDRVSGWYKRYVQRIILVLSILVVIGLNVDTINIAGDLWRVPTERGAVVSAATKQVSATGNDSESVAQQVRGISALELPLGWSAQHQGNRPSADPRHFPTSVGSWVIKLLGMLLSVIALSLGAPFWFTALSKLGSLRQSGPKPATSS